MNRAGSGIDPQFDAGIYNYLVGDVLEAKGIDDEVVLEDLRPEMLTAPGQFTKTREGVQMGA